MVASCRRPRLLAAIAAGILVAAAPAAADSIDQISNTIRIIDERIGNAEYRMNTECRALKEAIGKADDHAWRASGYELEIAKSCAGTDEEPYDTSPRCEDLRTWAAEFRRQEKQSMDIADLKAADCQIFQRQVKDLREARQRWADRLQQVGREQPGAATGNGSGWAGRWSVRIRSLSVHKFKSGAELEITYEADGIHVSSIGPKGPRRLRAQVRGDEIRFETVPQTGKRYVWLLTRRDGGCTGKVVLHHENGTLNWEVTSCRRR